MVGNIGVKLSHILYMHRCHPERSKPCNPHQPSMKESQRACDSPKGRGNRHTASPGGEAVFFHKLIVRIQGWAAVLTKLHPESSLSAQKSKLKGERQWTVTQGTERWSMSGKSTTWNLAALSLLSLSAGLQSEV